MIPKRKFGKLKDEVSVIGLGGGHLAGISFEEGVRVVQEAIASGITYLDTAPSYAEGRSEEIIGKAIAGKRHELFLASKVLARNYRDASQEIEGSLRRLKVERLDLLQIHAVNSMEMLEQVIAPNGSYRAAEEMRQKGCVRHIGISGHKDPDVILEALHRRPFVSALVPLGGADMFVNSFAQKVLPYCRERTIAAIGMKIFSHGLLPPAHFRDALAYSLQLPATAIVIGVKAVDELRQTLSIIETGEYLRPPDEAFWRKCKELADEKKLWWKQESA